MVGGTAQKWWGAQRRDAILVALEIESRDDGQVRVKVFSGLSLRVSQMCSSMIFSSLFGLHAWLAQFLKFARVIPDSRRAVFNHLKNLLSRYMSEPSMYQEIPFSFVKALDYIKRE